MTDTTGEEKAIHRPSETTTSVTLQPAAFDNRFNYHPSGWYSPPSLSSCTLYKKSHKTPLINDCNTPHLMSRLCARFDIFNQVMTSHL